MGCRHPQSEVLATNVHVALDQNIVANLNPSRSNHSAGVYFFAFLALSAAVFWGPLVSLIKYSREHESSSHIILIPFISAGLVYLARKRIFEGHRKGLVTGTILVSSGLAGYWLVLIQPTPWADGNRLAGIMLAIVTIWIGGFVFFFGVDCFRKALFPLLFLLFMVPIAGFLLDEIILQLRKGSTEVAYGLFTVLNVPVYREGFLLSLPDINIEVARECSGIRSSLALVITSLLAGHITLHSWWRKGLLCLLSIPLALFKNGVRIVVLSLLGIYVDRSFLSGNLHHRGGIVFFLLALILLWFFLWLLHKSELTNLSLCVRAKSSARPELSGSFSLPERM